MGFFRYDSPVMEFIGKVADFIVLNFIWVICCIPVITIGAATSAKYTVSMRIIRNESTPIFTAFFKAFKDNFKQATIIWCILMLACALCVVDWYWIKGQGDNISEYYVIAVGIFTVVILCVCMSVFPFIARFKVTVKEALKAAVILSFLQFLKFVPIAILEVGTFVAAIWYSRYFPWILLFGTCSAFYFNTIVCVKEFKKIEDRNAAGEAQEEPKEQIFHDASHLEEEEE